MKKILSAGLTIVALTAATADAQQPRADAWSVQRTAHFDLHFRAPQARVVDAVALEAEREYTRITQRLRHELGGRMPIIIVERDEDLPRTSAAATAIVVARGASYYDHLMLSVEGYQRQPGVIAHELTHQFVFEVLPQAERDAPWLIEGLPDHHSGVWTAADLAKIREGLARNQIPAIGDLTAADRHWGHVVFDFIADEYGARGLRQYLAALRPGVSQPADPIRSAFGVSADQFNRGLETYIAARLDSR